MHRTPAAWRTRFVRNHLPAEGAWWLRGRVENRVPVHYGTTVVDALCVEGRVELQLSSAEAASIRQLKVDRVVAGTGYDVNIDRLSFLDPCLRRAIQRQELAPKLNAAFEASVPGLYFVGPSSAMSFGPLFRFVVGAEYTARIVSAHLASKTSCTK